MIAVIDSGVANLTSVVSALNRLDCSVSVTTERSVIKNARRVILPGVGTAAAAMAQLQTNGLDDLVRELQQPVLGICLGMQLLFEESEEGGNAENPNTKCLGLLEGTISKLTASTDTPIPHMGWNQVDFEQADCSLLKNISNGAYFYFVHSFAAQNSTTTVASCDYGQRFTAICNKNNFWGCQFHPERSGACGTRILLNFIEREM